MKSYFVFLCRNKLYTAIQIFGLSVALGFVILLLSIVCKDYRVGKTRPCYKQLYTTGSCTKLGVNIKYTPDVPVPPQIKEWTRMTYYKRLDVILEDETVLPNAKTQAVDSTFFRLFDYGLRGCNRHSVLTSRNEVILSESFARKAFPDKDAVGQQVRIYDETCTVVGVMEDFGPNDIFHPTDLFYNMSLDMEKRPHMAEMGTHSFVMLADGATREDAEQALLKIYKKVWPEWQEKPDEEKTWSGSSLTRLDEVYLCDKWHQAHYRSGNKEKMFNLLAVAMVLLVSAVFNYVNLTVALVGKRAKEIATRRLLGDSVWQVVGRSLTESFLFTSVSFLLGCLVAVWCKEWFQELLSRKFDLMPNSLTIGVALGLIVVVSLLAGLIPAVIVSRFKPIDVMKGSFRQQNKMWLSRVFIVAQGVICTVPLALALTMSAQIHHLSTLPLGYNTKNLLLVSLSDFDFKAAKAEPIYNRLKSLPQVKRVGWIETEPWTDLPTSFGVADEGKNGRGVQVCVTEIDQDCMDMFGFEVVEQFCEPGNGMYWLTESAKRKFNVSKERPYINEVGYNQYDKTYIVKSEIRFPVCGVVKDFRTSAIPRDASKYENVIQIIEKAPLASSYIMLELDGQSGTDGNALKSIKAVCNEVAMEITGAKRNVDVMTVEEILDGRLYRLRNKRKVVLGFMFLSLLISALGMLAMSVSYTEQQSKQIALRKVMGSTVEGAAWELSRPFLLLSLLSSVIAVPISIKGMREYLEPFYYRIDFPWWVLVVAVLISLSVAVLSVLWQTLSVARRNPVESIRTE